MTERPILFSAPMVRAILAGTKTQTRRVVKPAHKAWIEMPVTHQLGEWDKRPLPYGKPGDRLWVRVMGEATYTVGLWSGRDKATCRPSIAKHEYEHTPPELAQWLVDLAERCKRHNAALTGERSESELKA
jgi:hypothetical protein